MAKHRNRLKESERIVLGALFDLGYRNIEISHSNLFDATPTSISHFKVHRKPASSGNLDISNPDLITKPITQSKHDLIISMATKKFEENPRKHAPTYNALRAVLGKIPILPDVDEQPVQAAAAVEVELPVEAEPLVEAAAELAPTVSDEPAAWFERDHKRFGDTLGSFQEQLLALLAARAVPPVQLREFIHDEVQVAVGRMFSKLAG